MYANKEKISNISVKSERPRTDNCLLFKMFSIIAYSDTLIIKYGMQTRMLMLIKQPIIITHSVDQNTDFCENRTTLKHCIHVVNMRYN